MPRYRHVLAAFDGSPDSELALEHAVAIAQHCRARLGIVAVVGPVPAYAWQAPGGVRALRDSRQHDLEGALRTAADAIPDEVSVTTQLLDGDPASGFEHLLGVLRADRNWKDGLAKKHLVAAFNVLDDEELVGTYRRKMSSLLF